MKKIILLLIISLPIISISQTDVLEISVDEKDNILVFKGQNNSDKAIEATLQLKDISGLRASTRPQTVTIEAEESKTITTAAIKGEYSYQYNSNYKVVEKALPQRSLITQNKYPLENLEEINNGIVVFDKTDCPRCNRTVSFLSENKIPFKTIDIRKNKKGLALMNKLLIEDGNESNFTTPVILVNGEISYSHENLEDFLSSFLKK